MTSIALVCRRVDRFCARLNDGLAAVALLLALLAAVVSIGHHPEIFQPPADTEMASPDLF